MSERYHAVCARIEAACRRVGRDPDTVRLVAVTKRVPADMIRVVAAAGATRLGENYVQEWQAKREQLRDIQGLEWHFIGRVQRNKARYLTDVALIHAVDKAETARALDGEGVRRGSKLTILLQVNLVGERTKGGVSSEELPALLAAVRTLAWVRVAGLMTIPPPRPSEEARVLFRQLRELRDRQERAHELCELSMGMSGDFEAAIEEGATLVRIGTAIFGPRREAA